MARQGFTLIEIVLTLSLMAIIAGFVLNIEYQDYQKQSLLTERDKIITLLQTARARATYNAYQLPHGLAIYPPDQPNNYVLFAGPSYADSDKKYHQVIEPDYHLDLATTSLKEVIFSQLSGVATTNGEINLTDPNNNYLDIITVNHEGAISW